MSIYNYKLPCEIYLKRRIIRDIILLNAIWAVTRINEGEFI